MGKDQISEATVCVFRLNIKHKQLVRVFRKIEDGVKDLGEYRVVSFEKTGHVKMLREKENDGVKITTKQDATSTASTMTKDKAINGKRKAQAMV